MIGRPAVLALAGSALVAVAMPLILLRPGASPPSSAKPPRPVPVRVPASVPLAAAYERPLFAAPADTALPADAPLLTGIAGRIGSDAVAFVRTGNGESRRLAPGESVDGWRLESLAIDAAFFTRGTERARVALPASDSDAQ